jgi:translation initiation factor 2 beta subunit (eIF-2beta)/eIF-5
MKCSQILKKISECPKRAAIYNKINPQLFDVSLRDGIQTANVENFTTKKKMILFNNILRTYSPPKIEVGSLTNAPNLLPIMGDTLILHEYSKQHILPTFSNNPDIYVLIPTIKKLETAIAHNITNFSFLTSVSDRFQQKNVKRNITETKFEFDLMFSRWFREPCSYKTKLYISCFNYCPIIGKIDNDFIINEVLNYHKKFDFNELCLSDTMGNISYDDFEYIIDTCMYFGLPKSKLSFHFHVSEENYENLEKILFYCFSKNLNNFDVSMLETGGCSVTMGPNKLRPNMSYDLFYSILYKYINRYITFENLYGKDFDKRYVKN